MVYSWARCRERSPRARTNVVHRAPCAAARPWTQALAKLLEKELLPDLRVRAKTPAVASALERQSRHV